MNRLRELRVAKNVSQVKIAELVKVRQNTVSRWEREDRGITSLNAEQLITLSKFFHVSIDYLLGISPINSLDMLDLDGYSKEESEILEKYRLIPLAAKNRFKALLDIEIADAQRKV